MRLTPVTRMYNLLARNEAIYGCHGTSIAAMLLSSGVIYRKIFTYIFVIYSFFTQTFSIVAT